MTSVPTCLDNCIQLSQFAAATGVFSNVVDFDLPLGLLNVIWLNFTEDIYFDDFEG